MSTPVNRLPSLDGLRATAIGFVLFGHAFHRLTLPISPAIRAFIDRGNLGVQIFFVISGFIITYLLLKELEGTGRIALKNFYIRRTLRIFPAFYTLILVLIVLSILGLVTLPWSDFVIAGLYLENGRGLFGSVDALSQHWYIGHTWSLAIEEQFYVLWPSLLAFCGASRAWKIAISLVLAEPVLRVASYYVFPWGRTSLPTTIPFALDPLMIGALAAFAFRAPQAEPYVRRFVNAPIVAAACLISFCLDPILESKFHSGYTLTLRPLLECVPAALLILYSVRHSNSVLGAFLNCTPMVVVGYLSYGLYLWQQLFLVPWQSNLWPVQYFPLNLLCAFACATASYLLIERPIQKMRLRFTPATSVSTQ